MQRARNPVRIADVREGRAITFTNQHKPMRHTAITDRAEYKAMHGDAPPTEEELVKMRDHGRANAIHRCREEGQTADYLDEVEAHADGCFTRAGVKRVLWDLAEENEDVEYVGYYGYLLISGEERDVTLGLTHRSTRDESPVLSWAEVVAEDHMHSVHASESRRLGTLEPDDISIHGGPHGIRWSDRWHEDDVRAAFETALEAAGQ
jgi:hypothetical protein